MSKWLLSLLFFGFTEQVFSQSGGESGGSESGGGSGGGSVSVDPNYFVDRYTLENDSYVPNPYPLNKCVQVSIWDEDTVSKYAYYTCSQSGTTAFRNRYDESDCSGNATATHSFDAADITTDGDLNSFYCDGDSYSINLATDCGGGSGGGDSMSTVPYVCFRDSDSSLTISNAWECDSDDETATFLVYSNTETCDSDSTLEKDVNGTCTSEIWTTQISGLSDAVGLKLSGSGFNCPSSSTGGTGTDDSGESGESDDSGTDSGTDSGSSDGDSSNANGLYTSLTFIFVSISMFYATLR